MLNIPATLKIGGHQYKVLFPYQFKERVDICGMSDNKLRRIMISPMDGNGETRPDTEIISTLFHEIIHAIDSIYCSFQIGKECNKESLTEAIAQGLVQVFIDNPGLRNGDCPKCHTVFSVIIGEGKESYCVNCGQRNL